MVKRYSVSENIYEGLRPGAAMVVVSASDYDALAAKVAALEATLKDARYLLGYMVTLDGPDDVDKFFDEVTDRIDDLLPGNDSTQRATSETNRNQAGTAPSDAGLLAPTPRGSLPNSLGASTLLLQAKSMFKPPPQLQIICDCPTRDALVCKQHPDCRPSYCKMRLFDQPPVLLSESTPKPDVKPE